MTHEQNTDLDNARPAESQAAREMLCVDQAGESLPAIRYMDEATFRRSLDKVLVAHERLLAKLAE